MKQWVLLIVLLITLPSLFLNYFLYKQRLEQNKVVDVVDGDTFALASGKRVRLLGIDAPEYDRCGGTQAKERLEQLIGGKRVKLTEERTETFGRTQALVYLDGKCINEAMMAEGWGRPDYQKNSQRQKLTDLYHQAKEREKGIFGKLCRDKEPNNPDCVIKGNIDISTYEKFYHLPSCRHYDQIVIDSDRGERYFCTEQEASQAGFGKAKQCP